MTINTEVRDPLALWAIPVADLGGVARHVLDVVREGIPEYRLAVLCPEGPLVERLRDAGVQVAVGKFGPDAGFSRSVRTLRRAVTRLQPAVVHSHLSYADIIVAATPMPRGVLRVTTEHGIAGDDRVYHGNAAKSQLMAAVHSARLRQFDAAIAVAEATKQAMIDKWSPKQQIQVILNGVDPVAAAPREGGAHLRILALARLSPEKRIPQLLKAFQLVLERRPDAKLTVAGVGELESELKDLTKHLGIEQAVDFPGFVDPEVAMTEADVLAQLSVWENCSYSLLDAANRGMRVIASRVGGNPEIVDPRGLVDADDIQGVADALLDESAVTRLDDWLTVGDMTAAIANVYAFAGQSQSFERGQLPEHVTIATNNGDIGGGEVMLMSIAEVLRTIGVGVTIVGPSEPGALVAEARVNGFETVELRASNRREWMVALRDWDRTERKGVLWCNGLVPALATAGRADRIVHFHQRPSRAQQAASVVARAGALATLVPSESMRQVFPGATVLPNWSSPVVLAEGRHELGTPLALGFLGRFSVDKGVPMLAQALRRLEDEQPGAFRLRMAGEPRFVSADAQDAVEAALATVDGLVDFAGWVSRDEFLASIDLLVVPSVWQEPFGLVVTEAMSARVPVIVSDAGALPDLVASPDDVFQANDPAALGAHIVRKRDAGIDGNVSQNFERWQREYSPDAGTRAVRDLLVKLPVA
ncbi:glycosyltransferase family 4 protein [Pseudoclavibacter helvolus]|uniref:glycosyltransferase family 4 protein n=1 Tax=Pseudoclavibacter helvolus TaxID=255205 RepID=UPI0008385729|nr:glycosyltransferase family 4 protein [Pseudoclavibacter helvolus]